MKISVCDDSREDRGGLLEACGHEFRNKGIRLQYGALCGYGKGNFTGRLWRSWNSYRFFYN